jgi:hypothetical protein
VYVDSEEVNPMKRVAPLEYADTYDAEKYGENLLDVAESVLGVFGFSRTQHMSRLVLAAPLCSGSSMSKGFKP